MRRTNLACLLAAICLLVAGVWPIRFIRADEKPKPDQNKSTSFWMKKKLDLSQRILAGLATADFDAIAASAESMRNLSKVEGFVRGQTPGYRTQLQIFDEAAAEIVRQAQKDNVDGVALAFTQLTISCVNCHKHLRETSH